MDGNCRTPSDENGTGTSSDVRNNGGNNATRESSSPSSTVPAAEASVGGAEATAGGAEAAATAAAAAGGQRNNEEEEAAGSTSAASAVGAAAAAVVTDTDEEPLLGRQRREERRSSGSQREDGGGGGEKDADEQDGGGGDDSPLVDLTDLVEACAASLNVADPFVCDPNAFNLHDAMGATQLMDRKMDCCEVPASHYRRYRCDDGDQQSGAKKEGAPPSSKAGGAEEEERKKVADDGCSNKEESSKKEVVFPRPPPEGLDDPFSSLPWETLTAKEAACVAVEIAVRFQAFLSGSSVCESTFTCLYAHAPVIADMRESLFGLSDADAEGGGRTVPPLVEPIPEIDMRRYPQFVVFTCALVSVELTETIRGIVVNADIYEEEDFAPSTYDVPFYNSPEGGGGCCGGIGAGAAVGVGGKQPLPHAHAHAHHHPEPISTLRIIERALQMTMTQAGNSKPREEAEVILLILGFLFGMVSICQVMGKITSEQLQTSVEGMKRISQVALKRLEQLDVALSTFLARNQTVADRVRHLTCDPFVNRPRVGNTPIRKPMHRTPREAVDALKVIVRELDWALCDLLLSGTSLGRILRMLDRVQRSKVNILTRSLIVLNLYFEEKLLGRHDVEKLIWDHMRQLTSVPDELIKEDEHSRAFLSRLAKPVYDTLKVRALNRCRQRAYIESIMISDWVTLQQEAHFVDMQYQRSNNLDKAATLPYFSQYVLLNLVRIMDQHLSVGIEMGIFYGPQDASTAFWYRDFLLSALLNNMMTMRRTKEPAKLPEPPARQQDGGHHHHKGGGKGKKKNHKNKSNHAPKPSPELLLRITEEKEDEFELTLISVKRDMCRGTKRFIAALQQAGLVRERSYEFTSPERIFEERFEVFAVIQQPPQLTYDDYSQGSDFSGVAQPELLETTEGCFQNAKKAIEHMLKDLAAGNVDPRYAAIQEADLRALLKVCIGNSVYLLKLRKLLESSSPSKSSSSSPATATAPPETKVTLAFEPRAEFCTVKLS